MQKLGQFHCKLTNEWDKLYGSYMQITRGKINSFFMSFLLCGLFCWLMIVDSGI